MLSVNVENLSPLSGSRLAFRCVYCLCDKNVTRKNPTSDLTKNRIAYRRADAHGKTIVLLQMAFLPLILLYRTIMRLTIPLAKLFVLNAMMSKSCHISN